MLTAGVDVNRRGRDRRTGEERVRGVRMEMGSSLPIVKQGQNRCKRVGAGGEGGERGEGGDARVDENRDTTRLSVSLVSVERD